MATIIRTRTIRPSSHSESDPYRVKCDNVSREDTLQIQITHESDPVIDMLYQIGYNGLNGKNSIHFYAHPRTTGYSIEWLDNIQPVRIR